MEHIFNKGCSISWEEGPAQGGKMGTGLDSLPAVTQHSESALKMSLCLGLLL